MTTKFKANFLYAQVDENDVIMVGFADAEFETKDYILFQKLLVCDEQDKERGFDKVHIIFCEQTQSVYGNILKFVLKKGLVKVTLDSKTAKAINTDERLEIVFPADAKLDDIKQYLIKMFVDKDNVFVSEVWLIETAKPGHHINNVKDHLELARNPENIKFIKGRTEYLEKHGGSLKNETSGELIKKRGIGVDTWKKSK